jgi:hypothetical protein
VYVSLAADLEISKVHDLQEWANNTFQLRLEILNGQALSELLAEARTFFLAVEFLKVPSEMYPRPLGIAGTRYEELRVSWRDREPVNYSDFTGRIAATGMRAGGIGRNCGACHRACQKEVNPRRTSHVGNRQSRGG